MGALLGESRRGGTAVRDAPRESTRPTLYTGVGESRGATRDDDKAFKENNAINAFCANSAFNAINAINALLFREGVVIVGSEKGTGAF